MVLISGVIRKVVIFLIINILMISSLIGVVMAADTDNDGLPDEIEFKFDTDKNDADTDDDGILDGDEGLVSGLNKTDPVNDVDQDGINNALDADSDGDGIKDGTEKGLTTNDLNFTATDIGKPNFVEDADGGAYTTDPYDLDTDRDTWSDGEEDENKNGQVDVGETDPNLKDFDYDLLEDDTEDDDDDNDEMPDVYELAFTDALDHYDPDDRNEDYDKDGFTNYQEYLGKDGLPGNDDWYDPEDPKSPNPPPEVKFKVPVIQEEAEEIITFDESNLDVHDSLEDINAGLEYTWYWDDETTDKETVFNPETYSTTHKYLQPSDYRLRLEVKDQHGNIGEATLKLIIVQPSNAPAGNYTPPTEAKKEKSEDNSLILFLAVGIVAIISVVIIIVIVLIVVLTSRKKGQQYPPPYMGMQYTGQVPPPNRIQPSQPPYGTTIQQPLPPPAQPAPPGYGPPSGYGYNRNYPPSG